MINAHLAGTMIDEHTTAVVQRRYLDDLAADSPAEPIVRASSWSGPPTGCTCCAPSCCTEVTRVWTKPPLNLETDEMLSSVVEVVAQGVMRSTCPMTVRQFFALANQHMRHGSSMTWPAA